MLTVVGFFHFIIIKQAASVLSNWTSFETVALLLFHPVLLNVSYCKVSLYASLNLMSYSSLLTPNTVNEDTQMHFPLVQQSVNNVKSGTFPSPPPIFLPLNRNTVKCIMHEHQHKVFDRVFFFFCNFTMQNLNPLVTIDK